MVKKRRWYFNLAILSDLIFEFPNYYKINRDGSSYCGFSTAFVSGFLSAGGGDVEANLILSVPGGRWMAFALIILIAFISGMFIDWIGIIFILVPILAPIVPKLGFSPLWFTMMIIVNLQMSFLTPPCLCYILPKRRCGSQSWG